MEIKEYITQLEDVSKRQRVLLDKLWHTQKALLDDFENLLVTTTAEYRNNPKSVPDWLLLWIHATMKDVEAVSRKPASENTQVDV